MIQPIRGVLVFDHCRPIVDPPWYTIGLFDAHPDQIVASGD